MHIVSNTWLHLENMVMLPDRKKGRNNHRHGHLGTDCSCWVYGLLSFQMHCRIKLVASESDGDGASQLVRKPWCVRNDWKTKAHLILKGENLRGPICCPTLQGWHQEGAEISSQLRWAMGKSDQRADWDPKEGFLLQRTALLSWSNLKGCFRQNQAGYHRETDSSPSRGWMKRPPVSLATQILH